MKSSLSDLPAFLRLFVALCAGMLLHSAFAVQIKSAIPYTSDGQQLLDLYLPDDWQPGDNRPAAILIHGGAWVQGHRIEEQELAMTLAANGVVAIAVDYRLAPLYQWPAQGLDVAEGVWWLRNNAVKYGANPSKIVAIGVSAGGHLAGMLGQTNLVDPKTGVGSQVQALVSMWGPWDLTVPENLTQRAILRLFLASSGDAVGASPTFRVSAGSPPALLIHGTEDALVPYKGSVAACAAHVAKNAQSCQLVTLQGQGHNAPPDRSLVSLPLEKFLRQWVATPQLCSLSTTSNAAHVTAGRAYSSGGNAFARGSDLNMGPDNAGTLTRLAQTVPGYYLIGNCP